jgi:hypothetical protein
VTRELAEPPVLSAYAAVTFLYLCIDQKYAAVALAVIKNMLL